MISHPSQGLGSPRYGLHLIWWITGFVGSTLCPMWLEQVCDRPASQILWAWRKHRDLSVCGDSRKKSYWQALFFINWRRGTPTRADDGVPDTLMQIFDRSNYPPVKCTKHFICELKSTSLRTGFSPRCPSVSPVALLSPIWSNVNTLSLSPLAEFPFPFDAVTGCGKRFSLGSFDQNDGMWGGWVGGRGGKHTGNQKFLIYR